MTHNSQQLLNEVNGWITAKEADFIKALHEVGKSKQFPVGFEIDVNGRPTEFTGAGLCEIASGAMEVAEVKLFGPKLGVQTATLYVADKSPGVANLRVVPHQVNRFWPVEQPGNIQTSDATFRQRQPEFPIDKVLVIPTREETEKYHSLRTQIREQFAAKNKYQGERSPYILNRDDYNYLLGVLLK